MHKHINAQLLRPYECSLCYKTFQQKNHLTRHIKIHTGDRQHKCPYCGKAFLRSDNLKKHIRIHTGEKFLCPFCSRGFTDSSNLTKHIRTHTGEGRHLCKVCFKHFSASAALQKHIQEHAKTRLATETSFLSPVKTEIPEDFEYSVQIESNYNRSNGNDPLEQSLSRPERNQNSNPDRSYLEKTDSFNANLLSPVKYEEPFPQFVPLSQNIEKDTIPFTGYSPYKEDNALYLHKPFKELSLKLLSNLTTKKLPIPLVSENQESSVQDTLQTSDLLQEQQNYLDLPVTTKQEIPQWQCVVCQKEFPSCFLLLSHFKIHVSDNTTNTDHWGHDNLITTEASLLEQLSCGYCEKVFTQKNELLVHMNLTLCKNCGKIFACCLQLENHKEVCRINWKDKEAEIKTKNDWNRHENTERPAVDCKESKRKNQTLTTEEFSLLPMIKQEIVFSDSENLHPDTDLSKAKSPTTAVDTDFSLINNFSTSLASQTPSQVGDNTIDSSHLFIDTNTVFPLQRIHSNSNQENLDQSSYYSGLSAQLDIQSKQLPEDKTIITKPTKTLILPDSQILNSYPNKTSTANFLSNASGVELFLNKRISLDQQKGTLRQLKTASVYKAYKCAKSIPNNPNARLRQKLSFLSSLQSTELFWCQNCGNHFQSELDYKEHLKFLKKFINKFSPNHSHKLEALIHHPQKKNSPNSPNTLERNSMEKNGRSEQPNCENSPNQPVEHSAIIRSPLNDSSSFTCSVCSKTFLRSTHLNRHRKIHFGTKNHRCTFCPKTFLRSDNLQKHVRIHLGIKQYACAVCKRRFTDSSNLVKHQRTHGNNEQGFPCKFCNIVLLNYQALCKHLQSHKPNIREEQQSTANKLFQENNERKSTPRANKKQSRASRKENTKYQRQDQILHTQTSNNHSFQPQISENEHASFSGVVTREKSSLYKNPNCSDVSFENPNFGSSDLNHLAEPRTKVSSLNSFEQNKISEMVNQNQNSKHKTSSFSGEFFVDLDSQNLTANSQQEDQIVSKSNSEPLTFYNGTNQNEEKQSVKTEEQNNDFLQIIFPFHQDSPTVSKSSIPDHSGNCSSTNTVSNSLTEQMKLSHTGDKASGDKFADTADELRPLGILQQDPEMNSIDTKCDTVQDVFSATNSSCLFASGESVKTEETSKNLLCSDASVAQNTTEDMLEMSAYYNIETPENGSVKPILQELQLNETSEKQDGHLPNNGGTPGILENFPNSLDDHSLLGNLAFYLSQVGDSSLVTKFG